MMRKWVWVLLAVFVERWHARAEVVVAQDLKVELLWWLNAPYSPTDPRPFQKVVAETQTMPLRLKLCGD
jgi:hypothetical protein